MYAVSNKPKLTLKHIGLGFALHQATRSEALVGLFYAASHIIDIDTVRRLDTTIAENILGKFALNGNVRTIRPRQHYQRADDHRRVIT